MNKEAEVIVAISGCDDLSTGSSVNVVEGYFAREAIENLVEQGYDVKDFGFTDREITYGGKKETAIRKADWSVEAQEAKRVNYDPFNAPHLDKEENEDYMDNTATHKENKFLESVTLELVDAKIHRTYNSWHKGDVFNGEDVLLEITNNDLEQRLFYKIGTKRPIKEFRPSDVKMKEQPLITVKKGSITISRNKDRNQVTMTIRGNKVVSWTFTVDKMIWVAEIVEKQEPKDSELEMSL